MRVLLTGGTGFIGRPLCRWLAEHGHTVFVLTRHPEQATRAIPQISRAFPWDGRWGTPPPESFAGVDAVVNLLGHSIGGRATPARKSAVRESRLQGTSHLVDALERLPSRPRLLINASAIGYYGDRGDETLDESSPPGDGFMARLCRDWEGEAMRAEGLGLQVTRLRIGIVLDGSGGALRRMLPLFRLGLGGPLGSGRQWWSWISRSDLIAMIALLLERPRPGPVLAAAPAPVRQRDFARALGATLDRPVLMPVPAFLLRLVLSDFADLILESARAHPREALALGFAFRYPAIEEALRAALTPGD
ncbi:MAG: TIGR01777 family oxidoreductase [Candidatus Eisenbacteria bacterium]